MEIVRNPIPNEQMLRLLIGHYKVQCCGGFPLWLVGGADFYNDIDLYTNDWSQYHRVEQYLQSACHFQGVTPRTLQFSTNDGTIQLQLVQPMKYAFTDEERIDSTDLTVSACLLTFDYETGFAVKVKYEDDIRNRICRVIENHEWTEWRLQSYIDRGYRVIRERIEDEW